MNNGCKPYLKGLGGAAHAARGFELLAQRRELGLGQAQAAHHGDALAAAALGLEEPPRTA